MNTIKNPSQSDSHLGLWVYLMTDCVMFASLFATYAVLLSGQADGPGPRDIFDPSFILVSTIVLLTSTLTAGLSFIAAKHGRRRQAVQGLIITGLLGTLFIGMELYEFTEILHHGYSWQTSAFLSAFFTLVGTHGAHILVGLVWLGVLLWKVTKKGLTDKLIHNLSLFTLFWHFLDLIWIFIFTFVYMMGATI